MIEFYGRYIRYRCLHRQMPLDMRIALKGILHHRHIGNNQRVHSEFCRLINRPLPPTKISRMGKGINCHMNLLAVFMTVVDTFFKGSIIKIKTGKIARIGLIFKTYIDCIGAMIDGGFQGRQTTGRAE